MSADPASLFGDNLATQAARAERALAEEGYEGLIIAAGSPRYHYLDDNTYPFRANPWFQAWVPEPAPDSFVVFRPGRRPLLVFHQPDDYWHLPPDAPSGGWVAAYDVEVVRDPARLRDLVAAGPRWAVLGEHSPATAGLGDHDPPALLVRLDWERAAKTPYEVACMARATTAGVRAHRAAEAAFRDGASEYEVHLAYCQAAGARESELPYNNIIAFDRHAAVLHYQHLDRERPAGVRVLLIDAGASYAGYGCDITRTWTATGGPFADLVAALDAAQQRLVGMVRPGTDYRDIHLAAHREVAGVLSGAGLVRCPPADAVERGVTSVFFPHGIGHLLGLQVHDVGGLMAGPDGGTRPRPEGHPFLRLTRELGEGFAVTVEPGVYFIESLLAAARNDRRRDAIAWDAVDALMPFGGVRIEDNVVATAAGPRNLTREAFAAA